MDIAQIKQMRCRILSISLIFAAAGLIIALFLRGKALKFTAGLLIGITASNFNLFLMQYMFSVKAEGKGLKAAGIYVLRIAVYGGLAVLSAIWGNPSLIGYAAGVAVLLPAILIVLGRGDKTALIDPCEPNDENGRMEAE